MADVDIDPFEERESRPEEPTDTGENVPLIPGGGSTWEPEREQETSFGGMSQRTTSRKIMLEIYIKSYLKTSVKPQEQFTMIILILEVGNYTTGVRTNP